MPTYEYLCEKCEHEFEREQGINDPPIKTCPKCRGRKVKKLISATSFVLKGGGWYADGYGSAKGDKKTGDDAPAAESSSTSDSKSEKSTSADKKSEKKKGGAKTSAKQSKDAA